MAGLSALTTMILLQTAPAGSAAERVLTLQQATQTAIANQPQLRQAQAQSVAADARADQARAPLFPQITGTGSYSRSTANPVPRHGAFVAPGSASFNTFGFWNFGVSANQLIYDFGETPDRWRAAQSSAKSTQENARATELSSVLAVRTAFFQARAQKALIEVAKDTLTNQQKHLAQVQGFVDLGARPEIDLAQARTDVANAQVQVITSENAYATAKAQLNQAMGLPQPIDYDVADDQLAPLPEEDQGTDALVKVAFATRPELASVDKQIEAQERLVRASRANYGPTLSASTGISEGGESLNNLGWNWNGGITLTWSLFQGLLVPAQVREAEANLAATKAQRDTTEQQVRLEVEQARLAVRAAKASLVAVQEALTNAGTRLRLATGRYETGVGSAIEIADAQLAYTNAGAQRAAADYNLASARASLLRALGRE
jgi:outer membrane protein